jgi:cytochrome b subunit of formate dehydrogenase
VKTYFESYHGLAGKKGSATVANCASCHGAHHILPSSDPKSSVSKKNLVQTCGQCHPGAGERLTQGSVHLAPSPDKDRIVYYVTVFYAFFIIFVVGGMVTHNFLDFWRKLKEHYARRKSQSVHMRFNHNERIQHLILVLAFVVLGYTGFALKFPDTWWSWPLAVLDPANEWRGWIHRMAAVFFTTLCFYHLWYLFFTHRGKGQLRSLLPNFKDLQDAGQMLQHNIGRPVPRPVLARYSYIEKMEYWALVWGSGIMIATGLILTFENVSLYYLPKWAIDVATVIHYFEAILATTAIVVWHFYFTIFDPEHYPMNWSMTHGKSHEDREEQPPK